MVPQELHMQSRADLLSLIHAEYLTSRAAFMTFSWAHLQNPWDNVIDQ